MKKFICKSIADDYKKKTVVLYPVIAGKEKGEEVIDENPAGKVLISTADETVLKKFQEGKKYRLDFIQA